LEAAARRTMGVSSEQRVRKCLWRHPDIHQTWLRTPGGAITHTHVDYKSINKTPKCFLASTTVSCLREIHLLTDLCLDGAGDAGIADTEEATGGRARGEPVTASQPLHQGLKVDFQVNRRVLLGDLAQRLHGLVPHHRLLYRRQALQGGLQANGRCIVTASLTSHTCATLCGLHALLKDDHMKQGCVCVCFLEFPLLKC